MQPRFLAIAIASLALLVFAPAAEALDVGIDTWAGNLAFTRDRTAADTSFPGSDYLWGVSAYATQSLTDAIGFETGFYADPILRNIAYTLFNYHASFLTIGVGPFFGFFNDLSTLLTSGISTAITLELPGILFVSFRSDSTIGGELIKVGSYLQSRNDVSLGFYVPNAICTLALDTKSFEQKAAADTVVDALTEYRFSADVFKKGVPYRIVTTIAYQVLSKSFVAATTTDATLNSIVLGIQVDVNLTPSVMLTAGMEGTVYSFGTGVLVGSAQSLLFQATAGIRMNVDAIPFINKLF